MIIIKCLKDNKKFLIIQLVLSFFAIFFAYLFSKERTITTENIVMFIFWIGFFIGFSFITCYFKKEGVVDD